VRITLFWPLAECRGLVGPVSVRPAWSLLSHVRRAVWFAKCSQAPELVCSDGSAPSAATGNGVQSTVSRDDASGACSCSAGHGSAGHGSPGHGSPGSTVARGAGEVWCTAPAPHGLTTSSRVSARRARASAQGRWALGPPMPNIWAKLIAHT
jgi:hypothetical protein